MAALGPLTNLAPDSEQPQPVGFLALVGAFPDAPEYLEALARAAHSRYSQRSRSAPQLEP